MKKLADYAALTGPLALVVTLIGWLIAGFLPFPVGPSDQGKIIHFFLDDPSRVKAGFLIGSVGVVLMLPMLALISLHLFRMDRRLPLMALVQAIAAAVTVVINMFPHLIFALAAFRTNRDPGDILLLNDTAWLLLFCGIAPFMVQNIAIGIAILRDPAGLIPRWVAYLNFFVAFSFIPDPLAYFFKTGVFAWNGLFVFWLALTTYSVFLCVMSWACLRANRSLADDAPAIALTTALQGA
jgi:hypothetical protein